MTEGLTAYEQVLDKCSKLVLAWGDKAPLGMPSLRQQLIVDGVSLWDVMSAEMALYLIPDGLAACGRRSIRQVITPIVRPLKYARWKSEAVNTSGCDCWPSGKTALFLGFTAYLARDVLQPVMEMMASEGDLTPVLLNCEAPTSLTGKDGRHSVHAHRSVETVRQARELARNIHRASRVVTGNAAYQQLFEEDGRPLWGSVKEGVRRAFNISASRLLPDTIAVARHILMDHRPSVIVSIDVADPRTRIYSLLGVSLGIPTVQVQAGIVGHEATEWRFLLDDVVAAQGDSSKKAMLSHGVPAEKIHVTGSPRYDMLTGGDKPRTRELCERFGVPSGHRTVVFASSYFLSVHEKNLAETGSLLRQMKKAVFKAVAETPGVFLIVKPHPLEDVAETRTMVVDHSRVAFADPAEDIRMLAAAGDVFLSMGSTSTLDALILGKPTVCPSYPGWTISNAFVRTGAVEVPVSEAEVLETIREIANDGGAEILRRHADCRREYLASVVRDGGCGGTRRVVDLLNVTTQSARAKNQIMERELM